MGQRSMYLGALALLVSTLAPGASALAAGAANDHTVLILESTVIGGATSLEALAATAAGFDVELATDAVWTAKTTADFGTYRALILGDPDCATGSIPTTAATATVNVWGPAVDGNVLIVGTDASFHAKAGFAGAGQLINSGIAYAGATNGRTGAYICLSCYYNNTGPSSAVSLLSYFGDFNVGDNPPCHDDIHITDPAHPAMVGLTDGALSNWVCSAHELFNWYPSDFTPLVISENFPVPVGYNATMYNAPDGTTGKPFILARHVECGPLPTIGSTLTATPNTLWPPNKHMIDIVVTGAISGDISKFVRTITCNEIPKDEPFYEDGSDIFHFKLMAARNGKGTGRTYTITYTPKDDCGEGESYSVLVFVPHDQGNNR